HLAEALPRAQAFGERVLELLRRDQPGTEDQRSERHVEHVLVALDRLELGDRLGSRFLDRRRRRLLLHERRRRRRGDRRRRSRGLLVLLLLSTPQKGHYISVSNEENTTSSGAICPGHTVPRYSAGAL